jgi:hypothetical protein
MIIQKTSETRPLASHTVNAYSESESNAYSCDYINDALDYSTDEVNTHKKWIDGKDIYRKVYQFDFTSGQTQKSTANTQTLNASTFITLKGISTSNPISECYYLANDDRLTVILNASKQLYINIGSSYPTTPCTVYVIVEYTKTTQSTRSINTYSGDIEEKKDIVVDDGNQR